MAQTIEGFVGTSLDDARMSPIHWRVFALISAGYFFDVCDYVILGALIPDMVRSGFATPAQIATVASATLLGLFVGTLAQGEFTDRFGRKTVYQFNLLLYGLATIAAAFSPNTSGSPCCVSLRVSVSAPSSRCALRTPASMRRRRFVAGSSPACR
jgi:MFS transporter, putative metabolite:H+ symporter